MAKGDNRQGNMGTSPVPQGNVMNGMMPPMGGSFGNSMRPPMMGGLGGGGLGPMGGLPMELLQQIFRQQQGVQPQQGNPHGISQFPQQSPLMPGSSGIDRTGGFTTMPMPNRGMLPNRIF